MRQQTTCEGKKFADALVADGGSDSLGYNMIFTGVFFSKPHGRSFYPFTLP